MDAAAGPAAAAAEGHDDADVGSGGGGLASIKCIMPPRAASRVASQSRCWRQVACHGQIPGPRSGAASVVVGNRLYMFGGYGGSGRLDDFFEFNFDTKAWSRVEYSGPSPGVRENNGVVEFKGKLCVGGHRPA